MYGGDYFFGDRIFIKGKLLFLFPLRDVSSVGSERLLDRQEVTGSIPVRPTKIIRELRMA
jgi:hypothetical protein